MFDPLFSGLGRSGRAVGLDQVPWQAWRAPLSFWLSLSALASIAWIALSLIVHRQWAHHERLRYPLASFATSLMPIAGQRGLAPTLRSRLFWTGFCIVVGINLLSYLRSWFPQIVVYVPLSFDFTAVTARWPNFNKAFAVQFMPRPTLYPMAMALAYLLASDVGLSLWTSHVGFGFTKLALLGLGVAAHGSYLLGGWDTMARFGGFVGTVVILVYIGRHYYWHVARRSAGLDRHQKALAPPARALRVVVLAMAAAVAMLASQGLDWPLAVLAMLLLAVMFVVAARMSAEAGLFALRGGWSLIGVLYALFGGGTLGVSNLVVLGMAGVILCGDTVDCLMPHLVNALKVGDDTGVAPPRLARTMGLGYVLTVAVAVVAGLWAFHAYALPDNKWANQDLPTMMLQPAQRTAASLGLTNTVQTVDDYGPLERLAKMNPTPRLVYWMLAGLGAVLVLSALRLRLTWWPLHPIFVLVWGSWYAGLYCTSIMLGWGTKWAVTRIGGGMMYARLKPLMIGLLAGDVLAAFLRLLVSVLYYGITGVPSPV